MYLHSNIEEFKDLLEDMSDRTKIGIDILEKDYYVCLVLKDIASKQDELKAYFKGGTAVYKILDEMYRFSEDIDLTVKVLEEESNTRNQKRLKLSAFDYNIEGLELDKEKCIDKKGSITAFYSYNKIPNSNDNDKNKLQRDGEVQIESTSFTVSEPTKKYTIMPLIYKLANDDERKILKERYDISEFDIEIIKLERIFIDKIFACEFYYLRSNNMDTAKHLYDITVLYKNDIIKELLKDKDEVLKLIGYKRDEEERRIGGINKDIDIINFSIFNEELDDDIINALDNMQNKYVLNKKYCVTIEEVKDTLSKLHEYFKTL